MVNRENRVACGIRNRSVFWEDLTKLERFHKCLRTATRPLTRPTTVKITCRQAVSQALVSWINKVITNAITEATVGPSTEPRSECPAEAVLREATDRAAFIINGVKVGRVLPTTVCQPRGNPVVAAPTRLCAALPTAWILLRCDRSFCRALWRRLHRGSSLGFGSGRLSLSIFEENGEGDRCVPAEGPRRGLPAPVLSGEAMLGRAIWR